MKKPVLLMGLVFLLHCSPSHNLSGTTDETMSGNPVAKGLYGKLVDVRGAAVFGAKVKVEEFTGGLQTTRSAVSQSTSASDSVSTDSGGYYSFESLNAGKYNFLGDYDNGKLVCFIRNIFYDSFGMVKQVKTDTLRAPGQITGSVNTHSSDGGGILCYVPGTSYLSMTDDTGGFLLSNIPQGTYAVTFRKDALMTISTTSIEVRSGEKTMLPVVNIEADPAYPPPVPTRLAVVYDTLHGWAILAWNPVLVSDLVGYAVYRNDTSSPIPLRINEQLTADTFYTDTIFDNFKDTVDRVLSYRLKAQDKDANLSTVYSKAFIVSAVSPAKARTCIALKFLNAIGDSASIGDTVAVMVSYANATHPIDSLRWFVDSSPSPVRTIAVSSLSGSDTLRRSWPNASKKKVVVAITDKDSITRRDSTTLTIVQDVPAAEAGRDMMVSVHAFVPFMGKATQRFGTIVLYKWDFSGDGSYDDSSTVSGAATHTYDHEGAYKAVFYVRDDDGNEAIDSLKVTIVKAADIRTDTTISINDSILFSCAIADTNSKITEYAWDFNGDGIFEWTSTLPLLTGYRYTTSWVFNAVLRVKDNDARITYYKTAVTVLRDVPAADRIKSIDAGFRLSRILKADGTLWTWGMGGELGDSTTTDRLIPVQIMNDVRSMVPTGYIKTDGTLWLYGSNWAGRLGDGTTTYRKIPVKIMSDVKSVATSSDHTLILKTNGTLWACGRNYYGKLGDATMIDRLTPVQIMSNVKSIAVGNDHSLILKDDGVLWACGRNSEGQLGDGTTTDRATPLFIMGNVQNITAGGYSSVILKTNGILLMCGQNTHGELGDGTSANRASPKPLMNDVQSMVVRQNFTLILRADGTSWACGSNSAGQLGDGTTTDRATPTQIMSDVQSLAASNGGSFSVILKTNGTLWTCGWNQSGELGDGTTINHTIPVQVMHDVQSFTVGYDHSMILKTDGSLWAFGGNQNGQIGDGTTTNRPQPVRIIPPQMTGKE